MKNISSRNVFSALAILVLTIASGISTAAQAVRSEPELSVAGFQLGGDEAITKAMLQGYSPRYDNALNQPKFFFYNSYASEVMSITGYSKERPYLIVAIEVFAVGESYQNKHYQMKDKNSFITGSGFFIGERASAKSLIFAIPNVTVPKKIIQKKGVPDADEKVDKVRTLRYQFNTVKELEAQESKTDDVNFGSYTAEYRFVKNKLKRFSIAIDANSLVTPAL